MDRVKREARRFVDGLSVRLAELDRMAVHSHRFLVYEDSEYVRFKAFFLDFIGRIEEFQTLSALAEETLSLLDRSGAAFKDEHRELDACFRALQVAMLQRYVATQLRLLKVWDDRWRQGAGLPYGASELFAEAITVIHGAKSQLLRPRYVSMLDEQTVEDAENAERLVRSLIKKAPKFQEFASDFSADLFGVNPAPEPRQPFLPGIRLDHPPFASGHKD